MGQLGFERFAVIGHDRGARVGYRLALDHPQAVAAFVSLTVVPILDNWAAVNKAFALNAYHWFLLAQPYDLPERLIGADPEHFLDYTLRRMAQGRDIYHPQALESYRRAFRDPAVRHAMCEDYRAAVGVDADADQADRDAGRRLQCPVQVLWQERPYAAGQHPLEIWKIWAGQVEGAAIGASHMLPRTRRTPCWSTCWGFSPATGRRSDERRRTRSGGAGDALATAGVRGARGDVRLRRRAPSA